MKLILKLIGTLSCGLFAWTTTELVQQPKFRIEVGNMIDNLGLIIICFKILSLWDTFNTSKTTVFRGIIRVCLIICNLFYSSFIIIKDNFKDIKYQNQLISVTRELSLDKKNELFQQFGSNLNIDSNILNKWKNIDLTSCHTYSDILSKIEENILIYQDENKSKPSIMYALVDSIHKHPILTLCGIFIIAGGIYYYQSEIYNGFVIISEKLVQIIQNERDLAKISLIQAENNKMLVDIMALTQQSVIPTDFMLQQMKLMLRTVISLSKGLNGNQQELSHKLNETIVVLAKLIQNNPELDPQVIIQSVSGRSMPIDLV